MNDDRSGRDRVRLPHEAGDAYDTAFYRAQLIGAAESVLAPSGWRADDIEAALADHEDATLSQFFGETT